MKENRPTTHPEVLILLSYHSNHSWEADILSGITEWKDIQGSKPNFHLEWMDTKNHYSPEYKKYLTEFISKKYSKQSFDLVITVDDNALDFAANKLDLLKDVPIVFSGVGENANRIIGDRRNVTGIIERLALSDTLKTALSLHPETRDIVFITASNPTGLHQREEVNRTLNSISKQVRPNHIVAASLEKIEEDLAQQPRSSLIFTFGSIPATTNGAALNPEEVVSLIRSKSNLPLYSDQDTTVGHGVVGGYMNSGIETGRLQAKIAQSVLTGLQADSIPHVQETPRVLLFDYKELQRLGLNQKNIPSESGLINVPFSIFDKDFRFFLISASTAVALLFGIVIVLIILNRIQAERQAELRYREMHDILTGLPNRNSLNDTLSTYANSQKNSKKYLSLIMMDLNRFKLINDTYGHAFGDSVILQIADRLKKFCQEDKIAHHFSGDSFLVLSYFDCKPDMESLHAWCDNLFKEPIYISEKKLLITAAFGINIAWHKNQDIEKLIQEADLAMHEAKRQRGTQIVFYDERLQAKNSRQFQIESDLPELIKQSAIEVNFQPIIDIKKNRLLGFEALARWNHPLFGNISPPEFIKAAIDSGCIESLTQCILRKACVDFLKYFDKLDYAYLSVNVSVTDICGYGFSDHLKSTISETGMPPERLILEITEDMLLGNEELAANSLKKIRELGIRIAIDDFGTGYSSMSYLSSYNVNIIKIDQSFIRNILTNALNTKIVRSIVSMADDLDLIVITEGIEEKEQLELLIEMGCTLFQGYYFGKPKYAHQWAEEIKYIHLHQYAPEDASPVNA